jgi:competence protein ComEC
MNVIKFPLSRITIFFILGVLVANFIVFDLLWIILTFSFSAAFFLFLFFKSLQNKQIQSFGVSVILLSFFIGFGVSTFHNEKLKSDHYTHFIKPHTQKIEVFILEKLKSNAFSNRYFAKITGLDGKTCKGKILLNIEKTPNAKNIFVGQYLKFSAKIYPNQPPKNPAQFDYGRYLNRKSVFTQVYIDPSEIEIGEKMERNIWFFAAQFRETIISNLQKNNFHEQELQVVNALILGQQQNIDQSVIENYQMAGAVHVLSVSGLHVGFLLVFINFTLGFLPKTRFNNNLKLVLILFLLWAFAVVAGLSPSVVRSATMFSFIAIGQNLKRETNIFHTLLVSILLILLVEPSFIFDVGFQLSYVSLFFILWVQPYLAAFYEPKNKFSKIVWDILTVSVAAQLGAFPLSIFYFHQFPGLFFLTNLVILPAMGVVMALGLVVMLMAFFNFVPHYPALLLEKLIFVLNWIIAKIASIESFVFKSIPLNIWITIALYLLIVCWFLWFMKKTYTRFICSLCSLVLVQICFLFNNYKLSSSSEFIVFNLKKHSLFVERFGKKIYTFCSEKQLKNKQLAKNIENFEVENFIEKTSPKELKNVIWFKNNNILVIDSLGIYEKSMKPNFVILRQSPKINLERFLDFCNPKMIVADGSNYKSLVLVWAKTCAKRKIPFHATAEKGFFVLK